MIEKRTFLIAKILLEDEKIKTITEIAEKLNVSSKTISRQLPKVEKLFSEYNLQMHNRRHTREYSQPKDLGICFAL